MAGRVLFVAASLHLTFLIFIFEIWRVHKASFFENSLQPAVNVCDLDLLILFVTLSDSKV